MDYSVYVKKKKIAIIEKKNIIYINEFITILYNNINYNLVNLFNINYSFSINYFQKITLKNIDLQGFMKEYETF